MPVCSSCRRSVRTLEDGLCLHCRIDFGFDVAAPVPKIPPSKTTRIFASKKDDIPVLFPIVHHAWVTETVTGRLVKAKMYCGLESLDPIHKFTYNLNETTCEKCLDAIKNPVKPPLR
jgi:hypothetical protein